MASISAAGNSAGIADQFVHVVAQASEVDAPAQAALFRRQIVQQEAPEPGIGHRVPERPVDLAPPRRGAQIDRLHGLDIGQMAVTIGDRRDVHHDQATDQVAPFEGQQHGGLTAHGVAQHRCAFQAVTHQEGGHVLGHLPVGHALGPGRGAVIAQVEGEDPVGLAQLPRVARPVAARAEQAVQDNERRPGAGFGEGEIQRHEISLRRTARRCQGMRRVPAQGRRSPNCDRGIQIWGCKDCPESCSILGRLLEPRRKGSRR
jgi:hypothetical protein